MKIRGLRWWIAVLLLGAAILNYIDRQTLSALAPTIQKDLEFGDKAYANVVNLFLLAYTVAYLVSGKLADRMGTRASAVVFVGWWSVINALTATATGLKSLSIFRFMLGLGEAGVWPVASKAVSEWFPPEERGTAIGLYSMGATIGATIAPYIVIPLAQYPYSEKLPFISSLLGQGAGWRLAFIITGTAGLLWLIPWLLVYRNPKYNKLITEDELQLIANHSEELDNNPKHCWSWRKILTCKVVWLLLIGRLLTDSVWYFYQFWFPKYLHLDHGLEQSQLTITWIVYAAAGIGSLLGGWLSGRLIKNGIAPARSRIYIMAGCAALMLLSPLVAQVSSLNLTMALTAIVVFASLAWLINISTLIVDVIPQHSLGTVFSVIAAGSTLGGIAMNTIVATMVSGPTEKPIGFLDSTIHFLFGTILDLVQGTGYQQWFLIMAFLHPIAFLILYLGKVDNEELK